MDNYMVTAIVAIIFSIFCFFMAHKTKIENEKRKKLEEERRAAEQERLDKAKQLKDEISRLHSLAYELSRSYITPSSSEEEKQIYEMNQEKRREYHERADALEKELYDLTGQPTSIMISAGIANIAREDWNKKHNVQPSAPKVEKKPDVPPELIGMSAALLTNAVSKVQKSQTKREPIRSGGTIVQRPTPIYFVNNTYEPGVVKVYISNNKYENGVVKVVPTTNRYEQGVIKAVSVDKYQAQMKVFLCKSRYD